MQSMQIDENCNNIKFGVKMQTDEDFNIKFVQIVQKYHCLYDKKVPEYRNKDFQEKSWIEISQETRESVAHCKERWRNLRACLSRYIKQQQSSDPQHKPYYLFEHMQYLLPYLKSARQLGLHNNNNINASITSTLPSSVSSLHNFDFRRQNVEIKTSEHDDSSLDGFDDTQAAHQSTPNRLPKSQLTTQSATSETDSASNFPVPDVQLETNPPPMVFIPMTHHTNISGPSGEHMESKRMRYDGGNPAQSLQSYHHQTQIAHHFSDSSDMDFFRSILPDIEGMNAQQKRKFKIGVLELIDDVYTKYPDRSNVNNSGGNPNVGNSHFWRK